MELSLYYKIREHLAIKKTNEKLNSVDRISYPLRYNNIPALFNVVVLVNEIEATSGYAVDYINGIVKFDTVLTVTDKVKATYYYCPFNIYNESSNETTDILKLPAIGIYEDATDTQPFELGNSRTEKTKTYVIQIWSEHGGERNDATDSIVELLEGSLPIIDYNEGFPTNEDGSKNQTFDYSKSIALAATDGINYRKGGSLDVGSKAKYFAEIYVDFKIFI